MNFIKIVGLVVYGTCPKTPVAPREHGPESTGSGIEFRGPVSLFVFILDPIGIDWRPHPGGGALLQTDTGTVGFWPDYA